MGSRYDDGYRSSVGRGPPPGPPLGPQPSARWDSERFSRESEDRYRGPPVMEREREVSIDFGRRYDDDRYAAPARPIESIDERYYHEERYGPPARRPERRYYDDDDYYESRGPPPGGAMIPYRPQRPSAPPRPGGLLRRQSSLDTFDRRPLRRYDYDERDDLRSRPPPVIPIPVPPARSPPRYSHPRHAAREYDDIRVAEPEYYGDEEFRGYREREWTRERSRRRSTSRHRSASRRRSASSSSSDKEVEVPKIKAYPRKGKTRMPKRLAHTKVLFDLGYPFYEEGEMIIIEKALGKDNIDEVVTLSREHREKETPTIHVVKSPPPEEKVTEEIIERKVTTVPISEAPRSVREWDNLKTESVRSVSPKTKGRSRSHHSRRISRSRRSPSPKEEVIEKKTIIREVSPARTSRSRRHSVHGTEIIEKREIIEGDLGESNSIHAGPLALVVDRHPKTDRDIKEEIRLLEAERRALRNERVEIRRPSRYKEEEREIIITRPAEEEVIEVRRDKKAPDPRLLRAMLATLT